MPQDQFFRADYAYGIDKEQSLIKELSKEFGELTKQSNKYSLFDFYNNECFVELKSRRCKHNTYPTTMVGNNKLNYAKKNPSIKYIFAFNFEDGLYYHSVDLQKDYIIQDGGGNGRAIKPYVYIPIEELTKI
jgi:hypothetical protein